MESIRKQRLSDVELDPSLNNFIWNGLHTIKYQIILGDCEDIAKIIPKRDYSLVIVDIPHGFSIPKIESDIDPYTFREIINVVAGFLEVTTSPFWRFVTFHSNT